MKTFASKVLFKTVILSVLLSLVSTVCNSQTTLLKNKANIVTLMLNYKTFAFEGGNLSGYDCIDCQNDTMPLKCYAKLPVDYGAMYFSFISTNDTVFYSTLLWMAVGTIVKPTPFTNTGIFENGNILADQPATYRMVDPFVNTSPLVYLGGFQFLNSIEIKTEKAARQKDTIWNQIDSLKVLQFFHTKNYHAIALPYHPAHGWSNPDDQLDYSKWIVILYYFDGINTNVSDCKEDYSVLKTLATDYFIINANNQNGQPIQYEIYDMTGKCVKKNVLRSTGPVELTDLKAGIYNILIYEGEVVKYKSRIIKK